MTATQALAAFLGIALVALGIHEYWRPELKAIVG